MDTIPVNTTKKLWERACSRLRQYIQHQCKLTHRYREQARSHPGSVRVTKSASATNPLWERACS
ncbi:hypothetical protein F7R20_10340 [Pseudomonas brassicacearum subsp. brassicacearum]|nr:hypothetical protein F7R20_10340 [Pseudomonas brassicacearum subsp. brassicacearum]PJH87967.1 hypothetical protein CVG87_16435 [Pseudomonas sp. WCS365]QEO80782.1 hypothetical protein ELZ14_25755 [Pseudomonas brassicacearum]